jgi:hypothetical protein
MSLQGMTGEIRQGDLPQSKEQITSQLFGQFEGYCKGKGLTKGSEYETRIEEIFQCSTKILWLDQWHPDWQITVYAKSLDMSIGFGVVKKKDGKVTKDVTHRNELKDLRYKISSCTDLELIDSHQEKFDEMFKDFKYQFDKIELDLQKPKPKKDAKQKNARKAR